MNEGDGSTGRSPNEILKEVVFFFGDPGRSYVYDVIRHSTEGRVARHEAVSECLKLIGSQLVLLWEGKTNVAVQVHDDEKVYRIFLFWLGGDFPTYKKKENG